MFSCLTVRKGDTEKNSVVLLTQCEIPEDGEKIVDERACLLGLMDWSLTRPIAYITDDMIRFAMTDTEISFLYISL